MKTRVLICIDQHGNWKAFGGSWHVGTDRDEIYLDEAWEWCDGVGTMRWIEADVPEPEPIPTTQAIVVS